MRKTIKQRTRVVGVFPNRASCERLVGALLVESHERWQLAERPYFNMENIEEEIETARAAEPACANEAFDVTNTDLFR